MIGYIEGIIIVKKEKYAIVETGGIGYVVFLSKRSLLKLPEIGKNVKLFCFHNIKEDASDLYGFLSSEEMDFFELLMDIHGVGPKAALEISSLGSLEKIKDRILTQDKKIFEGIPGIGAKKAMAIILELTGKIQLLDGAKRHSSSDPAEDALANLGFSRQQARDALRRVDDNISVAEERVAHALKLLGK